MHSNKNQASRKSDTDKEVDADTQRTDKTSNLNPINHYSGRKIRKSMWHYLLGRGMAAIGSLAVALLLIRVLPVEVYGAYTTLGGLLVTLSIISDAGLDRVLPKFLPLLRIANAESQLARLCWKLLGLRTVFIVILLIPVVLAPHWISSLLSIDNGTELIWPFVLYGVMWVISTQLGRTLQVLLQHGVVAKSMILEWFTKLAALVIFLLYTGTLPLVYVTWVQAVTIGLGMLYLMIHLQRHLKKFAKAAHFPSGEADIPRQRLLTFAWHNYLPILITIGLSEGTIKLISAYYLGITQTASLGFAYAIAGLLRQYLPAVLLLGLIEPAFMARYNEQRDFTILNEMASIVVKSNVFLLAPITVWLLLSGTPLIGLITGGKYLDTVWLLVGFMVALILYSHFVVLQLIANAVDESWLLTKCQLWAVLLAIAEIAAMIFYGLPGLLAGTLALAIFRNVYLSVSLRSKNYPYKPDSQGLMRIVILAVVAGLIGGQVMRWSPGISGSLLALILTVVSFLSLAYLWKPFKDKERELLNRFMGREIFIW
ncbi:MAG: lipopolysaccharide biosynthesis protein [Gammaproteobacteria bacterium]